MEAVKRQDSKDYIRNAVAAAREKHGLTAAAISGILCELLAESREMELTQMLHEAFPEKAGSGPRSE